MTEFIRKLDPQYGARIHKIDRPDSRERAVRLYCEQSRERWNLQIFGPQGIGTFGLRDGAAFMVATAHLDRETMLALRDAINAALAD